MARVIVCIGMPGIQINSTEVPLGQYLRAFDPDARGGVGMAEWTRDLKLAKRFPDMLSAAAEWKRQSTVRPWRRDGRPNRPLTAYSITIERVDEG